MKNNIQLVALDMDGTLFNNHGQISQDDQDAIREATEKGVHVIISTGRPYVGLPIELLSSLGMEYILTTNGAAIYHIPEKECIFSSCMTPEIVCPIIRELQKKDMHFDAFIGGNRYSQHSTRHILDKLDMPVSTREYIKATATLVDDLAAFIEEKQVEVQKMTLNFYPLADGTFKDRDAVAQILSNYPQIVFLSGGYHNLEFTKAGTTKGMGLRFLAQTLGLGIEQTMAVGDTQNDLDIIQAAGIGVAMGNALDEVKENADFISLSNEESGVAHAIRKFVL